MFQLTRLQSGLRVVSSEINGTEAITLLVLCGAGSRYETKSINGISHFIEHMFFKGAKKYPDCKSVAQSIDSIGGEFNAFTGKQYVGYYIKVPVEKYVKAFDVLSDMLINSKFDSAEMEKERMVIIEEINMYEDLPMQRINEIFEEQLFGDNPLGWNIAGTKDIVSKMTRRDLIAYKNKQYVPSNIVISVAGPIHHNDIVQNVKKYFEFDSSLKAGSFYKFKSFANNSNVKLYKKDTEQAHIILGVGTAGSENIHQRYIFQLLSIILGGNMSSRMFLSVREKQGLCYYINTSYNGYIGAGYVATSAGVALNKVGQALHAITKEYNEISSREVAKDELKRAKEYLKGRMTLNLEDSSNLAQFYANQSLIYNDIVTMADIKKEIDSVTTQEIFECANRIFIQDNLKLSVIGPFDSNDEFLKIPKM